MHTFGKVLTWLMVPLVIAGVILAGQAINVRNSWTEKADNLTAENQDRAARIEDKARQLSRLQDDYSIVVQGWNRAWPDVDVTVDGATGTLSAGFGTRQGILLPQSQELPVIQGFFKTPNGGTRYIGPFQVDNAQDDRTSLIPVWYPREYDIATWPVNGKWRFWESMPAEYSNRFTRLFETLDQTEEQLKATQQLERATTARNQKAKDQIASRNAELTGAQNPPAIEQVNPEDVNGLVPTITTEESNRDDALLQVDQLRRQIHAAQVRLDELLTESRTLVKELPGSPVDSAADNRAVR